MNATLHKQLHTKYIYTLNNKTNNNKTIHMANLNDGIDDVLISQLC